MLACHPVRLFRLRALLDSGSEGESEVEAEEELSFLSSLGVFLLVRPYQISLFFSPSFTRRRRTASVTGFVSILENANGYVLKQTKKQVLKNYASNSDNSMRR